MIRSTFFAVAATVCAAFAAPAFAATVIDVPDLAMSYSVTDGTADLVIEPTVLATFETLPGDYDFDMALTYSAADPFGDITGFFSLAQSGAEMLFAELTGASYDADTDLLTFGFAPVSGDLAAMFTAPIKMELAFAEVFGANPLASFVDGTTYTGSALATSETSPAPVPLPAGVWLLGSGLAALGIARRRRAA